jgi:hypothetical protein
MDAERPKNLGEYKTWLKKCHDVEISTRTSTYYDTVVSKAAILFGESPLWQGLKSEIELINQQYYINTTYYLLNDSSALPELQKKPFDSFLLKTFRHNVVGNGNWPNPPPDGWFLPDNWFSRINDMVRTYFVVKYLDGVNFFASQLLRRCQEIGHDCRVDYEAKEEGYYAAHFYVSFPCEIPRENWDTKDEIVSIEIQITTQLQEVIRRLLHNYYEQRRGQQVNTAVKWQWEYKSDEFAANYLGHILHYVEGMILDVRDKRIGKGTTNEG